MANRKSDDDVNTDHETVAGMADRLGLKGKARTNYIHRHMTGLGHRPQVTYTAGEDDDDDDAGGFFGSRSRRSRSRRSDDDDDDYPF